MSKAVANSEPQGEVQQYSDGILAVIERAVRDPSVDVDKMERLFALQERALDRQAKADFTAAKLAMQPELPIITMKGAIVIKDKNTGKVIQETPYAKFEDIHEAVMPILLRHGFDLKFKNIATDSGKPVVRTILQHVGGHSDDTEFELPMDTSGSKNNVQAIGSSTSYGKRYGVIGILNLRVHGEDDDAAEGGKPATISDEQRNQLMALSESVGADTKRFLTFMGVDGDDFRNIPETRFNEAWEALQAKGVKDGAKN